MNRLTTILFTFFISLTGMNALAQSSAAIKTYQSECGACHVPYPSVFLSGKSWNKLLSGLSNHFGDNAELAPEDLKTIKAFLQTNNFDHSRIKRRYGSRFDTPGTPIRITKTRFFQAIHNEVPDRWVTKNPKVKTFSRCEACHRGAAKGYFDEESVHIPR